MLKILIEVNDTCLSQFDQSLVYQKLKVPQWSKK